MSKITSPASFDEGATYEERVQSFRDIAREALRMLKMNKLVYKITKADKNITTENARLEEAKKDIKADEKEVSRVEYKISKLDEADPDYKEKKENLDSNLEQANKNVANSQDYLEDLTKEVAKNVKDIEEHKVRIKETMAKVEAGEWKVNLSEVNEMADKYTKDYAEALVKASVNV